MKTNNLKPCPLCGRNDRLIFEPLPGCTDVGNVACVCGASYTTITQGVDDWNTRPIEDGLQAELKEREALLEHIRDIADEHSKPDLPFETQEEWQRRQLDRIAWLVKNNIKKENKR